MFKSHVPDPKENVQKPVSPLNQAKNGHVQNYQKRLDDPVSISITTTGGLL